MDFLKGMRSLKPQKSHTLRQIVLNCNSHVKSFSAHTHLVEPPGLRSARDILVVTTCTQLAVPLYYSLCVYGEVLNMHMRHNGSLKPGIIKYLL